jgi:hypothetical protein
MTTISSRTSESKVVLSKLRQMRRKLTGWLLVQGVGHWLIVLLAVLACDVLLDRVFKMDFAQRLIMLAVMAVLAIVYFGWRVIRPLLSRPNDDALIYEVEKKHPELRENLISSWQLARQQDLEALGISTELAAATIHSGVEKADNIDFSEALDLTRYRQNWVILAIGVVMTAILAIGIGQTEFLQTWFNRNILLLDDQWPQGTYLQIAGARDGKLVLPRGADHRQVVLISEDSSVKNVNVSLEVDNLAGRTNHQMKSTGKLDGRENVFVFHNVSSTFRFRALGGDDVTEWVEVLLVEPPAVIELEMQARLPTYAGVSEVTLNGSGPHSVLVGSSLQIQITTNKLLRQAVLRNDDQAFEMQSGSAANKFSLTLSAEDLRGGEYQFELLDESGLHNSRLSKFNITIKEDQPPRVRANLLGISGLVVPRAMLPTSYQVADEFGIRQLYFDCVWKTGTEEEVDLQRQLVFAEFANSPEPTRAAKDVEVLDLLPLKLTSGTSFRFAVAAEDTRPEMPGIGRSQEFLLRVVSDEELRADLLRREIEQRKAFEQAYEVQMELASEIQAVAVKRPAAGVSPEQFRAQRESELIATVRNQKGIGTAVARVADRFEEFLVEVKNNRLDEAENAVAPSQKIETRFDVGIIQPIRRLDQELISLATRNLDNCRRASDDEAELAQAVDQTSLVHQQVLDEMKKILDAMNDSENFQEVINDLLEIKEDSNEVKSDIKKKLKPKNIFDDADDIFDK